MLLPEKVIAALQAAAPSFRIASKELSNEIDHLRQNVSAHKSLNRQDILRRLGWPEHAPGAYPTLERDLTEHDWLPCNHLPPDKSVMEEWKSWAQKILAHVTTCAVDGSQIFPSGDWGLPLGAVQIATFENSHDGTYSKNIDFELILPTDFSAKDDALSLRGIVSERRHRAEAATLASWMNREGLKGSSRLAIFDGTLITSFASGTDRPLYVKSITSLLEASATTKTPLVAYIDSSRARDLSNMHAHLAGMPSTRVADSALLAESVWGSRTPAYICARNKGLEDYGKWSREIGFLYLRSARDGRPARLEFPTWIIQDGLLEDIVNQVRAEIIAQGSGYPYGLEAADVNAVLSSEDRHRFESILHDFAKENGLHVSLRAKGQSKRRRR